MSYKQRSRLIIGSAVVFLFLVYFLGIKKTWLKYRECVELENKTRLAMNAPAELAALEKRFFTMEKSAESYAESNVQQSLLGVVSKYCNDNSLVVKDFIQPVTSTNKDVTIETNSFVVEGAFCKALQLVYNLEQVNKLGKVASVNFSMKKDFLSKSNSLNTTVYIQNLKKESNEN